MLIYFQNYEFKWRFIMRILVEAAGGLGARLVGGARSLGVTPAIYSRDKGERLIITAAGQDAAPSILPKSKI